MTDFGGYQDAQHPRDCATLYVNIIDYKLRHGFADTERGRSELTASWHRYLDACWYGGLTPEANDTCEVLYYERLRAAYHADTGKIVLPLPCYYEFSGGLMGLCQLVPDTIHAELSVLYTDYTDGQRRAMWTSKRRDMAAWMLQWRDEITALYPFIDWQRMEAAA